LPSRTNERTDSRERRRCAAHHSRAAAAAVILTPRQEMPGGRLGAHH
jgi:hypothetical protein